MHLLSHGTFAWPTHFLLEVVRKISVSSGIFLLVMPFWPAQKWFPAVLGLQVMDDFWTFIAFRPRRK